MLVFVLASATLQAQAPASSQPSASPATNGNAGGAAPSRANGQTSPSGSTTTRTPRARGGRGAGGGTNGANSSQQPAPADNSKVEVTGRTAANRTGTADRPLLPIPTLGNALGIHSGTPILVTLRQAVDSGHARNGDMLDGTLASPLAGLPAGTPVRLTVVSASRAGQLTSYGELSLQVVSIADKGVLSDIVTAQGKEGAKELPDAAPARGTEAIFTADQPISLPAA